MAPDAPTASQCLSMAVEADGTVTLTLDVSSLPEDTFVTGVRFPELDSHVDAGDVVCTIQVRRKVCEGEHCTYSDCSITLTAPAAMIIESFNSLLEADPILVQADAAGNGWIAVARLQHIGGQ